MNFLLLNLIIALLFTAITTFLIGLFVLFKSKGSKAKRMFAFYAFGISWWSFFMALSVITDTAEWSLFWTRLFFMGVWFIPIFMAHFFISLLNLKGKQWIMRAGYTQATFFSIMNFTPYMIFGAESKFFLGPWGMAGTMFHAAVVVFFIYTIYGFYTLFNAYLASSGTKRNQLNYLLWPTLLGYIGGSANFLLFYRIYIPILSPFGTYLVGLWTFIIAYAILKYQLMDIRVVIKKAFFYSIGISLVTGGIVGVSFLSGWFAENVAGFRSWTIPLITGFMAFAVGNLFWRKSKEVERLKYEFITVAAHKLRTPLTKVKWSAIALNEQSLPEKERQMLTSKILFANNQLIELVNSLLEVSKADANQYQYKLESFKLEELVKKIIKDFQPQLKEKNIKLAVQMENNLPMMNADRMRMASVIQILLQNAITYTKGEIKIEIKKEKNKLVFSVQDNGIGISKNDQPHIFSRFFRTHQAYLAETEGTGVGLFIAKNIIERHNGKIGVKSDGEGNGSIFWFSIPVGVVGARRESA